MADQTQKVVFGGGLDLHSGVLVTTALSMAVAENVHLRRGKAIARKGLNHTLNLSQAGTNAAHVLGMHPLLEEGRGAALAFNPAWGHRIFKLSGTGRSVDPTSYEWDATGPSTPRLVTMAEMDGKLFVAHNAKMPDRAITSYLDRFGVSMQNLVTLTNDDDSIVQPAPMWASSAPIRFRGVVRHLEYLWGWGWGTIDTPDQPEMLRHSEQLKPTKFWPEDYAPIGTRGDPIVSAVSIPDGLLVFKGLQTYLVVGTNPDNFFPRLVDESYGLLGARLAVSVGGVCYFWSHQGPRRTSGGPSQDLALPLGIDRPEVQALVSSRGGDNSFAVWDPDEHEVLFVFGNMAYVLSLWDPESPKWSVRTFPHEILSGAVLNPVGTGSGLAPEAPYTGEGHTVAGTATADKVTLTWQVTDVLNSDVAEIHQREGGIGSDGWSLIAVLDGSKRSHEVQGLLPGRSYGFAIRYKRDGRVKAGYELADASTWPAASRAVVTTGINAPSITGSSQQQRADGLWDVTISWINAHNDPRITTDLWKLADGDWVRIAQGITGTSAVNAGVPSGAHTYKVRHVTPDQSLGAFSADHVSVAQLNQPSILSLSRASSLSYNVSWSNGNNGEPPADVEVSDNGAADSSWVVRGTYPGGQATVSVATDRTGGVTVRLRHKRMVGDTPQYSPYTSDFVDLSAGGGGGVLIP